VTNGGTQKLPKKFKNVETYCHDHSLESSCSDGTISCLIDAKMCFLNFSHKISVLK
jgi:hypothetical protein